MAQSKTNPMRCPPLVTGSKPHLFGGTNEWKQRQEGGGSSCCDKRRQGEQVLEHAHTRARERKSEEAWRKSLPQRERSLPINAGTLHWAVALARFVLMGHVSGSKARQT